MEKNEENCPNFKNALDVWFDNQHDKDEFLKSLYYMMSGDRSANKVLYFHGSGNSGKSAAARLCSGLVSPDMTSCLGYDNVGHPWDNCILLGKRLNVSEVYSHGYRFSEHDFGIMTGNGLVASHPRSIDPIAFYSNALWLMMGNNLPKYPDDRFKIITFQGLNGNIIQPMFYEKFLKKELSAITGYVMTSGKKIWDEANNGNGGFADNKRDKKAMVRRLLYFLKEKLIKGSNFLAIVFTSVSLYLFLFLCGAAYNAESGSLMYRIGMPLMFSVIPFISGCLFYPIWIRRAKS